jgi:hypothetical protein
VWSCGNGDPCLAISLPKDVREVYWMRYPEFYKAYEKAAGKTGSTPPPNCASEGGPATSSGPRRSAWSII